MAISHDKLNDLLAKKFDNDEVEIIDLVGDQDHYEIRITSDKFNSMSRIAQHQLVMQTLGNIVGRELHAVSIKTFVKNNL